MYLRETLPGIIQRRPAALHHRLLLSVWGTTVVRGSSCHWGPVSPWGMLWCVPEILRYPKCKWTQPTLVLKRNNITLSAKLSVKTSYQHTRKICTVTTSMSVLTNVSWSNISRTISGGFCAICLGSPWISICSKISVWSHVGHSVLSNFSVTWLCPRNAIREKGSTMKRCKLLDYYCNNREWPNNMITIVCVFSGLSSHQAFAIASAVFQCVVWCDRAW